MNKTSIFTLALVSTTFTIAKGATAQSFDCNQAQSADEIAICGDKTLAQYDNELAEIYQNWQAADLPAQRTVYSLTIQPAQREWLLKRAQCGGDLACLGAAYQERKSELLAPQSARVERDGNVDYYQAHLKFGSSTRMSSALEALWLSQEQPALENMIEVEEDIDISGDEGYPYEFLNTYTIKNAGELYALTRYTWEYTGGAHGNWYGGTNYFLDGRISPYWVTDFLIQNDESLQAIRRALTESLVAFEEALIESGEEACLWDDIAELMATSDWREISYFNFVPVIENDKITSFLIQGDAYEFAPYACSANYKDIPIETDALRPFLKPEFAGFFAGQ